MPVSTPLRQPTGRTRGGRVFRRVETLNKVTEVALVAAVLCAIVGAASLFLVHQASVKATHARINAAWRAAQAPMIARLNQPNALEYGDVWGTHTGVVCGLVNGWGSFGGLSAMTPFYIWKSKPFFAPDITTLAFAPGWRECLNDHWIELVKDGKPTAQAKV